MSIKQFYYLLGKQSLTIGIYFTILAYIFLYIFLTKQKLELAIYLLMFLSIFYYFLHLYYLRKSNRMIIQIAQLKYDVKDLPEVYLIEQDQSNVYFFQPNGYAQNIGKIHLTWKGWYLTYYFRGQQQLKIKLKIKKNTVYFKIDEFNIFAYLIKEKNKIRGKILFENKTITFSKEIFHEINFFLGSNCIVTVKKGWLPVQLTNRFRLNTPIICFLERVNELEKDVILMVLMMIYWK